MDNGTVSHYIRARRTKQLVAFLASLLLFSTPTTATEDELQIALTLADVLRSARAEIANQQSHINNPDIGDKQLHGDVIVEKVLERLKKDYGFSPEDLTDGTRNKRLIAEQLKSIEEITDENQALINRKGIGFKGFVPAVFTQLVNERFGEKVGDVATIKVTAPLHLVRNRKARPDKWERAVIENKFSQPDWEHSNLYSEVAELSGNDAFRVMVPEYYAEACLSCHGAPQGELDVTGYPKEGGILGELGGAISISLFRE